MDFFDLGMLIFDAWNLDSEVFFDIETLKFSCIKNNTPWKQQKSVMIFFLGRQVGQLIPFLSL